MIQTISNPGETLKKAKTIAVVGCSPNPYRTSNYAANYLKERGYRVIPINPGESEILGEKCYPSINDIPGEVEIDIVNIFRNSIHTADEVEQVIEWKKKTGQNPVVWTQLDVSSKEGELLAAQADLPYVRNTCIMVELDKLG